MSEFERALAYQDESVRAAEPDGPDLPTLLSNRANRIALAVKYAVRPTGTLLDGIADLERSLTLMNPSHPARVGGRAPCAFAALGGHPRRRAAHLSHPGGACVGRGGP